MAAGIVDVLKTKIKENAQELENYEVLTEDTRNKYNAEKKLREETESEVLAMNRKIRLLEDNLKRNEDRLDLMTGKSQTASDRLLDSEDRRQTVECKYESTSDRFESLENQLSEAKKIAEESDQKCEEIVRKLMLAELQRDRAESKADRSDNKIRDLESELGGVNNSMKSLSVSGDISADKEDQNEDQVATLKQKFCEAEARAETAEREVQKLQNEVDLMEGNILSEKTKQKRMDEDMESLLQSINSI
eukprot:GFUD01024827.1.p1 GENE.GFUD01024827.1~~GFUD01024827.1.p1  ORF type:complete len:248 (+),score=96.94 GFUD01024827.1:257-1000(+)